MLKLVSDYIDYYDYFLHDSKSLDVFRRVTTDGLSRQEILQYLQKLDFTVPDYDLVKNLAKKLNPLDQIVLYHDTHAHRGEGKTLSTIEDALIKHPNLLASRYIPFKVPNTKSEIKGLSWRYLQIGTEVFWVEYTSTTDWRSNCGDGDINLFFRDKTELLSDRQYDELLIFKYPLFAIDFVPVNNKLYAIDFNIAPQIYGTGVEKLLTGTEAAKAIIDAYFLLKNNK